MTDTPDFERRFGGVRRLYGETSLTKFQTAHVVVIGIGGVGSWAAEALARNAIGAITLIDLDHIAESNINRQLHAVEGTFGKAKVVAMRERILAINSNCRVTEVEDFITPDNIANILDSGRLRYDVVVDCVDDAKAKAALAAFCVAGNIPLVMTGGAGGRLDPSHIKTADLAQVSGDRLLAKVRNLLRRDYAFPEGEKTNFGIQCVYSSEPMIKPDIVCEADKLIDSITGLNCAGYGSTVCVTAPFGFSAAALALKLLH
ncbi:MAG: tRNA threonylcarbamoyladenosine dehydratase [Methylophilaceae bacterium]